MEKSQTKSFICSEELINFISPQYHFDDRMFHQKDSSWFDLQT